jgi:hypothetical protein
VECKQVLGANEHVVLRLQRELASEVKQHQETKHQVEMLLKEQDRKIQQVQTDNCQHNNGNIHNNVDT